MEQIVGNTTEVVRMFWERMGAGDDVYEAIFYTIWHTDGIGPIVCPHYNYRLRGYGDISSIRLQN